MCSDMAGSDELDAVVQDALDSEADHNQNSAILKDEDRCIRCALCEMRCPVEAITMERVVCKTKWSSS